ncbi:hypothetical protein C8Q80DRAFT_1090902 [Daedaleopsis nitida]|nr:hypothetical protein C8Q80DRAFT_1090902 [Daedaleopsis nitida]
MAPALPPARRRATTVAPVDDAKVDANPRPLKRQRIQSTPEPDDGHSDLEPLTPLPPSSDPALRPDFKRRTTSQEGLKPIPTALLLVSLPSLLSHPPNHKFYVHSLVLSLAALRKCLALPALSPDIECRAWTGMAELGMRVISGGWSQREENAWARGIELEVEKALSRGSIIAQKHPSLRAYKHQLALLQAQLSQWQQKTKFARNQIRNLLSSFLPTDPPHVVYSAHLALIALLTTPTSTVKSSTSTISTPAKPRPGLSNSRNSTSSPQPCAQDIHAALHAVQELEDCAATHKHNQIALLARVLRTRILVAAGMWADVSDAIQHAETALGLSYEAATTPKVRKPLHPSQENGTTPAGAKPNAQTRPAEQTFIMFEDPLEAAMSVHLLMLSIVYYTHTGEAAQVSPRLSHLHALLDSEVLEKFPEGHVEVTFPSGPSLVMQVTHPRVLFLLAFLISSASKRDAVGRKPKRKVFANEGLTTWDNETTRDISFSLWSSMGDVDEVEQRLARIKADLLCEVIAVSIMRSEFDTAEENLDILIAHTRTYDIFSLFSARIALHHAHLAHALARPARALRCYRAAAHHSEPESFVNIAARAGEIALRVGVLRRKATMGDSWRRGLSETDEEWTEEDVELDELEARGGEVIYLCRGMGGTLEAVGEVLDACFTPEILKSKQRLKIALELATKAQDNHLRALILALIAAHYLHTAGDHARTMLQTCEQLAAGLGAPPTKGTGEHTKMPVVLGNAPLGLWVGERFLELFKRFGKDSRAQRQAAVNAQLAKAVEHLARRDVAPSSQGSDPFASSLSSSSSFS